MSSPTLTKFYHSNTCGHSLAVKRFLKAHDIHTEIINIDGDRAAREEVILINEGYASTPTLVFSDGSTLTEPSFRELRRKLGMAESWFGKLMGKIGL